MAVKINKTKSYLATDKYNDVSINGNNCALNKLRIYVF